MSRAIFHGLVVDDVPWPVPEPTPELIEPEPEEIVLEEELVEELVEEIIEEPPEPTWFDIWEAETEQADAMLLAARAQADDIRRRAQGEGEAAGYASGYADGLNRGRSQGYEEGHEQGYAAGHAEAIADAAGVLQTATGDAAGILHTATQFAEAARIDRRELLEAVDEGMVDLVIAICRKVIQAELATDPGFVRQCVTMAIRAMGDSPMAMVHINPEDAEILQETWEELRQRFGETGLQVVPDARIPRGGCIVDAETRTVDAQIDSKLEEIQRQLLRMTEPRS